MKVGGTGTCPPFFHFQSRKWHRRLPRRGWTSRTRRRRNEAGACCLADAGQPCDCFPTTLYASGERSCSCWPANAAIAYRQTDPPEIAEDFKREERLMEASGMNDPDYKQGGKFKVVPPQEVARILKS